MWIERPRLPNQRLIDTYDSESGNCRVDYKFAAFAERASGLHVCSGWMGGEVFNGVKELLHPFSQINCRNYGILY